MTKGLRSMPLSASLAAAFRCGSSCGVCTTCALHACTHAVQQRFTCRRALDSRLRHQRRGSAGSLQHQCQGNMRKDPGWSGGIHDSNSSQGGACNSLAQQAALAAQGNVQVAFHLGQPGPSRRLPVEPSCSAGRRPCPLEQLPILVHAL